MPDLAASVRRLFGGGATPRTPMAELASVVTGAAAVAWVEARFGDALAYAGEHGPEHPVGAAARAYAARLAADALNLHGRRPEAVAASGGRAALAVAAGMAAGGLRAAALLTGDELAASLDLLHDAAERRLPLVVHVVLGGGRRALGSDHRPWHAAADRGAVALLAGGAAEAADLAVIARRTAEEASLPVVVGMDAETALGVEDVELPAAWAADFLGAPDELAHAADAAGEMLFGRHRRRLVRWHDGGRPTLSGALLPPEAPLPAAAARRAYLDPAAAAALGRAFADLAAATGRERGLLRAVGCSGARTAVVAQGSVVAPLAAAAGAGGGLLAELTGARRPGVVALTATRPFPGSALAEALAGSERVVVLDAAEEALTREVRAALDRLPPRRRPPVTALLYALGGAAPRGRDLEALCEALAGGGEAFGDTPRYLGVDLAPDAGGWPKRQVALDALRRAYPQAAALGAPSPAATGRDPRPEGAVTVAVHRRGDDGCGELADEAAALVHAIAGGHLRGRRGAAWNRRGAPVADRWTWAAEPPPPPADDAPSEVLLSTLPGEPPEAADLAAVADGGALVCERPAAGWRRPPSGELRETIARRGLRLYVLPAGEATGGARSERLLGALLAVLAAERRLAGSPSARKVAAARRDQLVAEGREAGEVERRVGELRTGFDRTHLLNVDDLAVPAPADVRPPARELPPVLRRAAGPVRDTVDSLPRLWDQVGAPRTAGEARPLPDPHLATGVLPASSAALFAAAGAGEALPAFDPAPCTGCGACWAGCPHGAVTPRVLTSRALLEAGMRSAEGGDGLRRVLGKLASGLDAALADGEGGGAGELLDDAWRRSDAAAGLPEEARAKAEAAFAAVREALRPLPLARTAPFFDRPRAAGEAVSSFLVALDPSVCTGCGLCVAVCEPEALTTRAEAPKRRREAAALHRLVAELPSPDDAAAERAAADAEVGEPAASLLTDAARAVVAGDAAEAGSGEALAVRRVLGAAQRHLTRRRGALLARLAALADELAGAIERQLAGSLPGRDLDALSRGLAGLDRPEAELAELIGRVEGAFDDARVDVPRLRRLVDAARRVADLRWHLESGPSGGGSAPFSLLLTPGVAAWSAVWPEAAFAVPATVVSAGDAAAQAHGLAAGLARDGVAAAAVLRRARIELDAGGGGNAEQRAAAEVGELARLGWRALSAEERLLAAPLFVLLDAGAGEDGLGALLATGLPVRVVRLATGAGPDLTTLRAALEAPGAWVGQCSLGDGRHLAACLAAALDADGPALLRVAAPVPRRDGFPPDGTLARAEEQLRRGAWPLFTSPPAPEGERRRFEITRPAEGSPDGAVWEMLLALSGAEAEGGDAAEREGRLAALAAEHEAQLARLAGEVRRDLAAQVRRRLLALATRARSGGDETGA